MPVTKVIVGTRVGSTAALVPLTAYIAPYHARLIETALLEVDSGIIEAAQAMGANTFQIIVKFVYFSCTLQNWLCRNCSAQLKSLGQ